MVYLAEIFLRKQDLRQAIIMEYMLSWNSEREVSGDMDVRYIRKAKCTDANALKTLYFEYLTHFPPKEEQDMNLWEHLLDKFEKDENMYLLVIEEDGKVVSSVQMAIIENLTHNVRPFAVIENVVTHADYRNRGYASALLEKASEIAREHRCYKVFLETGSNKESTLNFYKKNGFEIDKKHSCLKRM